MIHKHQACSDEGGELAGSISNAGGRRIRIRTFRVIQQRQISQAYHATTVRVRIFNCAINRIFGDTLHTNGDSLQMLVGELFDNVNGRNKEMFPSP